MAVGRGVAKAVPAAVVGIGGVGNITAVVDHGAVRTLGDRIDNQAVPVDIRVIDQHINGRRAVFLDGGLIVRSHWRVVDAAHSDIDRRPVGAAVPVAGDVGEAVAAAVVGIGGVGNITAVVGDGAVRTLGDRIDSQAVAVDITVVGQHVDDHCGILGRDRAVVGGLRRVVRAAHLDGHRRAVAATVAVAYGVGKAVAAAVVGIGGVGDVSTVVDHGTVRPLRDRVDNQAVAVDVTVVAQHVDDHCGVLGRDRAVVGGLRRVVRAAHLDGHDR